jgi:copper ion binding protein
MSSANLQDVVLTSPDISCEHCVNAIQGAVGALDGVESVSADANTKKVDVSFDPSRVSLATIEDVMSEEGYPVAK